MSEIRPPGYGRGVSVKRKRSPNLAGQPATISVHHSPSRPVTQVDNEDEIIPMFVIDRNGNTRPDSDSSSTGSSSRNVTPTSNQRAISESGAINEQQLINEQQIINEPETIRESEVFSGLAPIHPDDSGFSPNNDASDDSNHAKTSGSTNQSKLSNRSKPLVHQSSSSSGHSSIVSASFKSTTQRQDNQQKPGLSQVKTEQVTHQKINSSSAQKINSSSAQKINSNSAQKIYSSSAQKINSSSAQKIKNLSSKPSNFTHEIDLEEPEDASMESPPKRQRLDNPRPTQVTFFLTGLPGNHSGIARDEYSIAIADSMKPFYHRRNQITIEINQSGTQAKVTFLNNPDNKDPQHLIQEGLSLKFGGYPVPDLKSQGGSTYGRNGRGQNVGYGRGGNQGYGSRRYLNGNNDTTPTILSPNREVKCSINRIYYDVPVELFSHEEIDHSKTKAMIVVSTSFTDQINLIKSIKLGGTTFDRRLFLLSYLKDFLLFCGFEHLTLHLIGSSLTGIAFLDADVDLFLAINPNRMKDNPPTRHAAINHLIKISQSFKRQLRLFSPVIKARVPIIKIDFKNYKPDGFLHSLQSGLQIDLSSSNLHGLYNTFLIKHLTHSQPLFSDLALLVKYWLKISALIRPNFITSYGAILMVLYFLQSIKLLPSVKELQDCVQPDYINIDSSNGIDSKNSSKNSSKINVAFSRNPVYFNTTPLPYKPSLAALFLKFFNFYAKFGFRTFVIAPYYGNSVRGGDINLTDGIQLSDITIQDVFQLNSNVGKNMSVNFVESFKRYFKVIHDQIIAIDHRSLVEKFRSQIGANSSGAKIESGKIEDESGATIAEVLNRMREKEESSLKDIEGKKPESEAEEFIARKILIKMLESFDDDTINHLYETQHKYTYQKIGKKDLMILKQTYHDLQTLLTEWSLQFPVFIEMILKDVLKLNNYSRIDNFKAPTTFSGPIAKFRITMLESEYPVWKNRDGVRSEMGENFINICNNSTVTAAEIIVTQVIFDTLKSGQKKEEEGPKGSADEDNKGEAKDGTTVMEAKQSADGMEVAPTETTPTKEEQIAEGATSGVKSQESVDVLTKEISKNDALKAEVPITESSTVQESVMEEPMESKVSNSSKGKVPNSSKGKVSSSSKGKVPNSREIKVSEAPLENGIEVVFTVNINTVPYTQIIEIDFEEDQCAGSEYDLNHFKSFLTNFIITLCADTFKGKQRSASA